jgi:hypothetical protein
MLVDDFVWLSLLDALIAFRREIKETTGLLMHDEVKANHLYHNKGDVRARWLSEDERLQVYRSWLERIRDFGGVTVFAVCINKDKIEAAHVDPRARAWQYTIQRFERFGRSVKANIHVLPDEGHGHFIRKKLREMRRFNQVQSAFGDKTLSREADNIVEDSSDRVSSESYFIQSADLIAYAAARHLHPRGDAYDGLWDVLGDCRLTEVNKLRGGPVGLVSWP